MFSSTIIPTINRSTLSRAVLSVLNQDFDADGSEVIVVNDSGKPLPEEDWQKSTRVCVLNTNCHERSVARNTGAAIAKGKYLHFLDDDDELLPGAIDAFWKLDQQTDAIWLYGSYQTVDNDGNLIEEIHPGIVGNIFGLLVAGESIPFGTSFVESRIFFKAGGFDPRFNVCEDRDVGRFISLLGEVAYTPHVLAKFRIGETGSTTNWKKQAEIDKLGREKALQAPKSFKRLRESAKSSYLRGRVSRAFLASAVWNLKRNNVFIAVSRGVSGLAFTGWNILKPDFYRGLRNL